MKKADNIKFDSNEGRFYGISESDVKQWKERYPYIDFDDFGKLINESAEYLRRYPNHKSEVKKNPRSYLEWFFHRENILLWPLPSDKKIKIKPREINTPQELWQLIEVFSKDLIELCKTLFHPDLPAKEGYNYAEERHNFTKNAYNMALGYATGLRGNNPTLPQLPKPTSDPITDLRFLQEWCLQPPKPAGTEQGDNWIEVKKAATIANVNAGTITRWANNDKITTNGKKKCERRIEKSSLLLFMQKRKEKERQKGYNEYSQEVDNIPDEH